MFVRLGLAGDTKVWDDKWLKWAFWTLNISLAAMLFMSLLPDLLYQLSLELGWG
ncbi:hypothetical protein L4D76_15160 [Photobacterium sagamiensis]|uniref:hypothetical protein n=1 Tax=Photobacterium sagamiensis TaxID=2910241 RepID=UPI003D12FBD7